MQNGCSFVLTCATYLHSRGRAHGLDKVDATLFVDGFGSEGAVRGLIRHADGVAWRDETLLSSVSSRCSLLLRFFPERLGLRCRDDPALQCIADEVLAGF
jgi:hypothetical protein